MSPAEMCRGKGGSFLTYERKVIERWEQHFNEHLKCMKNVSMEDQGSERNDYVSTVGGLAKPTLRLRDIEDVIRQVKINNKSSW